VELEDVLDQKISVEHARRVYGVVIGASGRDVDAAATQELRTRMLVT
jgi:hypothetical protein